MVAIIISVACSTGKRKVYAVCSVNFGGVRSRTRRGGVFCVAEHNSCGQRLRGNTCRRGKRIDRNGNESDYKAAH